jgi:hypothetical protein
MVHVLRRCAFRSIDEYRDFLLLGVQLCLVDLGRGRLLVVSDRLVLARGEYHVVIRAECKTKPWIDHKKVYFGLDATGFRSAYKFHRILGPILMVSRALIWFHKAATVKTIIIT